MIGKVPDGWRVEKVKNIVKIKKGKKVDIFEKHENGLFNYIDISVLRTQKYKYTNNNQIMATDKDILIVWDGANSGYSSFGLNGAVGSTLAKLTLNDKKILHTYFGKFIFSKFDYLSATSYGATIPHLQRQMLENISVPLPPLPQQEKIVKVLDISSALIEKQKELIQKYDLFLKSKFIEMFGDPISNPMGWEVDNLKTLILDVKNGLTRRSSKNSGDIVLKLKDIRANYVNFINLNRIKLDEKEKEKFIAEKDDLLFIRVNGNPDYVGRCAVFHGYTEPVYFNDHIMRIKVKTNKYNAVFLGYIINSQYGKNQIVKYRKTSAGQHTISQDGLERLSFYLPPIELQTKFASIVEKTEQIKEQETKKLQHLETLHKSLMDKAFKGEIQ